MKQKEREGKKGKRRKKNEEKVNGHEGKDQI